MELLLYCRSVDGGGEVVEDLRLVGILIELLEIRNGLEDGAEVLEGGEYLHSADAVHRMVLVELDFHLVNRLSGTGSFSELEEIVFG